jgi:hypothetical protein
LEDHDDLLHKMTATLEKQEKVMEVLTQKIMLLESHDDDNGEQLNNHSYHLGCLELPQQVRESRSNPFVLDLISSFRLLMFHLPWSMGPHRPLLDGLLFLLCLILPPVATIPGVAWKGTTLVPVVSMPVRVVVREDLIVVIVTVMCVVMLVGCIVSPLVP